jgi:PIN domain nuclease of toxin-antitoxin system
VRLLLDTHAFIWWDSEPERLSATARAALEDPVNAVLMSIASFWEIHIKQAVGKLALRAPLATPVADQQANGFHLLPVMLNHVLTLETLPSHHRAPFDRMLAAQAIAEGATSVTRDPAFSAAFPAPMLPRVGTLSLSPSYP